MDGLEGGFELVPLWSDSGLVALELLPPPPPPALPGGASSWWSAGERKVGEAGTVLEVVVLDADAEGETEEAAGSGVTRRAWSPRRWRSDRISWRRVLISESFHTKRFLMCSASAISMASWLCHTAREGRAFMTIVMMMMMKMMMKIIIIIIL